MWRGNTNKASLCLLLLFWFIVALNLSGVQWTEWFCAFFWLSKSLSKSQFCFFWTSNRIWCLTFFWLFLLVPPFKSFLRCHMNILQTACHLSYLSWCNTPTLFTFSVTFDHENNFKCVQQVSSFFRGNPLLNITVICTSSPALHSCERRITMSTLLQIGFCL